MHSTLFPNCRLDAVALAAAATSRFLFQPVEAGVFNAIGAMKITRAGHTSTLLPGGKVLAAGGENHNRFPAYVASAELYEYGSGNAPIPQPTLTNAKILPNGSFQFSFTNNPGRVFSPLAAPNPALSASNWTELGIVTETAPGQFQFTDTQAMAPI